jgi:hypothetical protein
MDMWQASEEEEGIQSISRTLTLASEYKEHRKNWCRHCTYVLSHMPLTLCCLPHEIDCCSTVHYWLPNIE